MRYDIKKLKRARLVLGWDQTTVAYKAGVSVATVNRMERHRTYSPETIRKIAGALKVRMKDLVVDDEPETVTAGE